MGYRKILATGMLCLVLSLILTHPAAIASQEDMMAQLVKGNTQFALDLYGVLRQETGNLFFSPYSISTALAMTYAGARSETAQQMAETLHFAEDQKAVHPAFAALAEHFREIQTAGNVALSVANALWIQQDFALRESFLELIEQYYEAGLFQVNFREAYEEVRQRINAWVEKQTQDKIQNLLAPGTLSALTRLVLTNAIYFKGNWAIEFEEKFTKQEPFWMTPQQSVDVPLMYQENLFKYGEDETMQILQMPYVGEELSLVVLLPKERDGLPALEAALTPERLRQSVSSMTLRKVQVFLPKFKLTSQCNLSDVLKALGMDAAFSDEADFSGMDPEKRLNISEVIHKAFVEVNEEGTEAAAATAVVVGVTSVRDPEPVPVFRADHPFLFLIHDAQTGSLLFLGRMANPAA
ncbi:serpin family protein [candidate division KSB3 bacterium]|uniref:Serpin family protein n=1 Tax=candidate division KSB3 bacterium TaxID=2044937 RepID=A0A9D5JU58_9BACT|nr:serpin family protein [candidate division KSB3 bacterium]MBD3324294.1 serpin family protein [candidate division KSB3 bacterium]